MNEAGPKVKQQVIDKIKSSTNILVTVSRDPTVDELAAAIGLTTILNKLGKHGTAIFSGDIPPAINFLDPEKVFENTADSLRDFIIALDKEKADHLRYKVEGDVVKIFITPYRTTITSDDLEFSQGDYNIELVLALGVANREHLDQALSAHGQVLHDVTIATFSAGKQSSQLGSLDWRDSGASSLSEMVTNLSELLKVDKPILDKQISTALLTGIVAATDRFSNLLTTSRVMTTAAQLMAAGADQQLIAARLQESHQIDKLDKIPVVQKVEKPVVNVAPVAPLPPVEEVMSSTLPDGSLVIDHDKKSEAEKKTDKIITKPVVEPLANRPPADMPPQSREPVQNQSPVDTPRPVEPRVEPTPIVKANIETTIPARAEPMLGGSLSATVDQASEDKQREESEDQNKTILSHSYVGDAGSSDNQINEVGQVQAEPVDIFADSLAANPGASLFQNSNPIESVNPYEHPPIGIPADAQPSINPLMPNNLPLPPQLPDFSTLSSTAGPIPTGFGSSESIQHSSFNNSASQQSLADNPSQFRIPGQ